MLSRIAVFRRSCLIRQFSSSDTSLVIDYRELPDVMQSHLPISPQRIRNFSIIAHIDHGIDIILHIHGSMSDTFQENRHWQIDYWKLVAIFRPSNAYALNI